MTSPSTSAPSTRNCWNACSSRRSCGCRGPPSLISMEYSSGGTQSRIARCHRPNGRRKRPVETTERDIRRGRGRSRCITGIHAKRWTREQDVRFFVDVNGSNPEEVASEVDRYCSWPGAGVQLHGAGQRDQPPGGQGTGGARSVRSEIVQRHGGARRQRAARRPRAQRRRMSGRRAVYLDVHAALVLTVLACCAAVRLPALQRESTRMKVADGAIAGSVRDTRGGALPERDDHYCCGRATKDCGRRLGRIV
jgi:Bacterial protein of unknown function (DUF885)